MSTQSWAAPSHFHFHFYFGLHELQIWLSHFVFCCLSRKFLSELKHQLPPSGPAQEGTLPCSQQVHQEPKETPGSVMALSQLPGMWLQAPESPATSSSCFKSSGKLKTIHCSFLCYMWDHSDTLFTHSTPGKVQAPRGSVPKTSFSKSLTYKCCYCNTKQLLQLVTWSTYSRNTEQAGLEGP